MPRSVPSISVIVPVYNGGEPFRRCLRSLRAQRFTDFELIVADDGSTDGSAELAEGYADQVLRLGCKNGPGCARNAGAAAAQGRILAFTDADCVLPERWLERIDRSMDVTDRAGVAGGYAWSAEPGFWGLFSLHELGARRVGYGASVDTAPGANLAVRAALFREIGGFPTDLDYASTEDMVFTLAVSRRGELAWDAHNGVGHHFRRDLRGYLKTQWNYARPLLQTYGRHPGLATARSHHPRSGWLSMASAPLLLGGVAGVPLFGLGTPLLALGLALALAPELGTLRFLRSKGGGRFALGGAAVIPLRNVTWFLGALRGAGDLLRGGGS